jgi:hypothetical protein
MDLFAIFFHVSAYYIGSHLELQDPDLVEAFLREARRLEREGIEDEVAE